ncbi:MAG: dihydroorotase [Gammaproteobacteria bacterium]|nr:dihydroorotase [Gammaproteobacteria bacterium]
MKLHIQGGRLIDPANDTDTQTDLFISDGKIAAIGQAPAGFQADQVIDASGQVVCPGLIDLQVRPREPGQKHKGTIASETRAAATSGITTLCCPPDTSPVIGSSAVVKLILDQAEDAASARILPIGALTSDLKGEQLAELHTLKEAGCVAFSNARNPIRNTLVMRRAMEYAASHNLLLFIQAEDAGLGAGGCVDEGPISIRMGLNGIPETAETIEVSRILLLAEQTGARIHFGQLSTAGAVDMIRQAQNKGLPVTADVAIHHLHLTNMDVSGYHSHCHVRPPLRDQRSQQSLKSGLVTGAIGAICSDHQPHDADAKLAPFAETEPGISGLETLLPLTLRLVDDGTLTMSQAIASLTAHPAEILDSHLGQLGPDSVADICIFEPETRWSLSKDNMVSHGCNSPFFGWDLKGRVSHTIFNGEIVYQKRQG